jgi:hypothetical protein
MDEGVLKSRSTSIATRYRTRTEQHMQIAEAGPSPMQACSLGVFTEHSNSIHNIRSEKEKTIVVLP